MNVSGMNEIILRTYRCVRARMDLSPLRKYEIKAVAQRYLDLPRNVHGTREKLVAFVHEHADEKLRDDLQQLVANRCREKDVEKKNKNAARKRRRNEIWRESNKRRKIEDAMVEEDSSRYLELPTGEEVKACYKEFYKATSSAALAMAVCAVCGRQKLVQEGQFSKLALSDIPNGQRLYPRIPHPAHDIYNGMLLEPEGMVEDAEGESHVRICADCHKELRKNVDRPPEHSLANNLWIGRVPWQLSVLTVPEQLLIAHAYPRAYVYKLYPKSLHCHVDDSMFQRGIRGNVTTYALDANAMTDMVMGRMLPRPQTILPSLISITFFGRGKLPKSRLRNLFKVRRQAVRDALIWLKANNPKYYGEIDIDEGILGMLPEDDVPEELYDVVRQSEDVGVVEEERAGYVNEPDEEEGECHAKKLNDCYQ
jgi:hypothetical protein